MSRITPEEIEIIKRMALQGYNRNRISIAIGRAPLTVKNNADRLGIELVDNRNSFTEAARQRLIELFHKGLSDLEIGNELGYGRSTISNERARLELYRPKSMIEHNPADTQPDARAERFQALRMRLITEAWV